MNIQSYTCAEYVRDIDDICKEVVDEEEIVRRIAPLAGKFAQTLEGDLVRFRKNCDEKQGFAFHLLHEDADHGNAVFVLAWLPGRGAPPHNHKTWGIIVGLDGEETETRWQRKSVGPDSSDVTFAQLGTCTVGPGDISSILSEEIHSVVNETDGISLSLHTYGKHINYTGRSSFDEATGTESKFVVDA